MGKQKRKNEKRPEKGDCKDERGGNWEKVEREEVEMQGKERRRVDKKAEEDVPVCVGMLKTNTCYLCNELKIAVRYYEISYKFSCIVQVPFSCKQSILASNCS